MSVDRYVAESTAASSGDLESMKENVGNGGLVWKWDLSGSGVGGVVLRWDVGLVLRWNGGFLWMWDGEVVLRWDVGLVLR